jgi:hypothetical protein
MFNPPDKCKDPYEHTRLLPIPGMIDDYNHHIGRVDIADQLQSKFSTQQCSAKPWKPLFYWLLDTTIINAFLISENRRKAKLSLDKKDKIRSAHRAFREALVTALLLDLHKSTNKPPNLYITKTTQLPPIRLTRPIEIHQIVSSSKKALCFLCCWSRHHTNRKGLGVITKSQNLPKTRTICSHCSIVLCRRCFSKFHYTVD